jgi:2-polyprenyl-6-methoxyphenol hydroxylase-like FAD-dependent oxidoreductase
MKVEIVGGGPAGLYVALLLKRQDPRHRVRVIEQNPAGATYGWGVVFSDRALSFLAQSDEESYADIEARLETWSDQAIVHRGQMVRIDGLGFAGIARLTLLGILQDHCRRRGVELSFETRVDDMQVLEDADLIIGADGVNSVVRERHRTAFQPSVETLSNRYIWFGTAKRFDCLTLTFRENADGAFVAHHYRYSPGRSTFIVECDAETWARAGFERMTDDVSRRYCEALFRDDLDGEPLLENRSQWLNFRVGATRRWSHGRMVLVGDALRTVHFSIGSGTRMALEDAIALARACAAHADVASALRAFEEARRPVVDRILSVAARSFGWYERFRDQLHLEPLAFAHGYVMRSGRITTERLRERSPHFAAAWEARQAASTPREKLARERLPVGSGAPQGRGASPRALVIGGSLGGLFAARLLRRIGWHVEVFERVPDEMAGRGAGIATHPELFEALDRAGIPVDDSIGVEAPLRITLDAAGNRVGDWPLRQIFTSWGRIYHLLRDACPPAGYHQGTALARVEQDGSGVTAVFADGARVRGDLLVGADGLRSTVRAHFLPEIVPSYAGYVAWRGLVDEAVLSERTHATLVGTLAFCLPRGEQMLGYFVAGPGNTTAPGMRQYNFVWYRPIEEGAALGRLCTDARGHHHDGGVPPPLIRAELIDEMRRDAEAVLAPQFAEVVRATAQPFFQAIYDLEVPRMASGRVVLLGDAAFVARPHSGMGVTKAASDAVALADALARASDLDTALSEYDARRRRFGSALVAHARRLGAYMQAQIRTPEERAMAERFRTPEAVMRETAVPIHVPD